MINFNLGHIPTGAKLKPIDWLRGKIGKFGISAGGSLAIMAALLLPAIVLGAAVAVDYSSIYSSIAKLQEAADASAIASAREMALPNSDAGTIQSVAVNYVAANLSSANGFFSAPPTVTASADKANGIVDISITALKTNAFGGFLQPEYSTLNVNSSARALGGGKTCIIVLETSAAAALELKDSSNLNAFECTIQSNSASSSGIELLNGSSIIADRICSSGGVSLNGGITSVEPITDCPVIEDPLAYKVPPPVGGCDYNNVLITNSDIVTLEPGVYCGGLTINNFAQVTLLPGIYVMKDGALLVTDEASLIGDNIGIFFLGDTSEMLLTETTFIEITAPKDGPMAGLLMFSDRGNQYLQSFTISSEFARVLLGTIYLPNGKLTIDSKDIVGDGSAYTVIVARQFQTAGAPEIVINSDYNSTDIPVPDGVGPSETQVTLIK